jgi:hypothetical protein
MCAVRPHAHLSHHFCLLEHVVAVVYVLPLGVTSVVTVLRIHFWGGSTDGTDPNTHQWYCSHENDGWQGGPADEHGPQTIEAGPSIHYFP